MLRDRSWALYLACQGSRHCSICSNGLTSSLRISTIHGGSLRPASSAHDCVALEYCVIRWVYSASPAICASGDQFMHRLVTSQNRSSYGKVPLPQLRATLLARRLRIRQLVSPRCLDTYHCLPPVAICGHHIRSPPAISTSTPFFSASINSPYETVHYVRLYSADHLWSSTTTSTISFCQPYRHQRPGAWHNFKCYFGD